MIKSSSQTKATILDAAVKTLQTEGFSGATSRAIGRTGGFNQALIFYHFGSLDALLLAALERTSQARLARYREATAGIDQLDRLLAVMAELHEEDRQSGHITVVSQMLAGSLANPELAPQVVAQLEPWIDLAEKTIARVLPPLVPPRDLAFAAVTFYLGVNLLTTLDPDRSRLQALFDHAAALGPLVAALPK
jgi:AcrR family transcriptional regulator